MEEFGINQNPPKTFAPKNFDLSVSTGPTSALSEKSLEEKALIVKRYDECKFSFPAIGTSMVTKHILPHTFTWINDL